MAHTRDWDSASPVDHTLNKSWPGEDRKIRVDVDERLKDQQYGFTSGETNDGIKRLEFRDQAGDPGAGTDVIRVYGKAVSGKTELFVEDEDGNVIQLTSGGKLGSAALNLLGNDLDLDGTLTSDNITLDTNNAYLKAKDAAGTGTIDLIKANASDVPVVSDGAQLATSAAPTADADIANKKFVDDQVATMEVSSILDYGTSGSSSTSKSQSALKIAYGTLTVSGGSSASISNLPFASASAYSFTVSFGSNQSASEACEGVKNSGSGATIYNNDNLSQNINWIAIGT